LIELGDADGVAVAGGDGVAAVDGDGDDPWMAQTSLAFDCHHVVEGQLPHCRRRREAVEATFVSHSHPHGTQEAAVVVVDGAAAAAAAAAAQSLHRVDLHIASRKGQNLTPADH
jgi:hypothetical protein